MHTDRNTRTLSIRSAVDALVGRHKCHGASVTGRIELAPGVGASLVQTLAHAGIAGGAVYDALIGLAAKQVRATLLTRDSRARATYIAIGVDHEVIG